MVQLTNLPRHFTVLQLCSLPIWQLSIKGVMPSASRSSTWPGKAFFKKITRVLPWESLGCLKEIWSGINHKFICNVRMEHILKLPNGHLQQLFVRNIFSFMSKFVLVSLPNLVVDTSAKNLFLVICFFQSIDSMLLVFPLSSFARFSYFFFWFRFWLSSSSSSPSKFFDPKLNIDSPPVHDAAIGCQPPKNHRRRRPKHAVVSARWWGESLCPWNRFEDLRSCRAISGAEISQILELGFKYSSVFLLFPWPLRKLSIHLVRALTSALASDGMSKCKHVTETKINAWHGFNKKWSEKICGSAVCLQHCTHQLNIIQCSSVM